MRRVAPLAAVLALCGCAQLGQFTAADSMQAAALATAVGDNAVVQCYQGFAAIGKASAGDTAVGILTGIETKRAIMVALSSPSCSPILAQVLADLLKATPIAPIVP